MLARRRYLPIRSPELAEEMLICLTGEFGSDTFLETFGNQTYLCTRASDSALRCAEREAETTIRRRNIQDDALREAQRRTEKTDNG